MNARVRRLQTAVGLTALLVTSCVALPSTSASITARTSRGSASFGYGGDLLPPGTDGIEQIIAAAVCEAVPAARRCGLPSAAEPVPPWLLPGAPASNAPAGGSPPAVSASPTPAPHGTPTSSPSPAPSNLPEPGERCETPECVEEAVHVVGAFAEHLQRLREAEPDDVPEQAVETISAFAEDLRELPEPPEEDLPLPEDMREALEQLVHAGVLEPFAPECVINVGQLAALVHDQMRTEGEHSPSPSPRAGCTPSSEGGPDPSETPDPEPGTEPEPTPAGEPSEQPYPYDGPGHRVRRAEPED